MCVYLLKNVRFNDGDPLIVRDMVAPCTLLQILSLVTRSLSLHTDPDP